MQNISSDSVFLHENKTVSKQLNIIKTAKELYKSKFFFSPRIIEDYYRASSFFVDLYYQDFGFMSVSRTMQFLKSKKLFKNEKKHHCLKKKKKKMHFN